MRKMVKKLIVFFMILSMMQGNATKTFAAGKINSKNYMGTYYQKGFYKNASEKHAARNVVIASIKKGYVTFSVSFLGRNYSPIYDTGEIRAKIKGRKAYFTWIDSWDNKGKGTITFVKRHKILLNMKKTKTAEGNRASLATDGNKVYLYYKAWHKIE